MSWSFVKSLFSRSIWYDDAAHFGNRVKQKTRFFRLFFFFFFFSLRLVGEAKLDAKGRVDVALDLTLGEEVGRVVGQGLLVLGVELDGLEVGLDAVGRDGLGEDGAAAGDWARRSARASGRIGEETRGDALW